MGDTPPADNALTDRLLRSWLRCRRKAWLDRHGDPAERRWTAHRNLLLVVQQEIAMGRPAPLGWISVAIKPGLATATQPTAEQPVGKSVVGRRGVTHPLTLRLPAAKSTEVHAVPWHRLPFL